MNIKNCLVCGNKKLFKYLDLGQQPLANNLSKKFKLATFPLEVTYCQKCYHNQLNYEVKKERLFSNYLYLSSQSKTLQNHFNKTAQKYIKLFNLKKSSCIVDVGSNDGISLSYYKKKGFKNIFGIEPAKNISNIANKKGINTINSYLNKKISKRLRKKADLVTASNVFAHNRDIKKLAKNLISMLTENGVLIIEVQYLISMLQKNLFDNIYHEHIHYWSINSLSHLFKNLNCQIFKIEKIDTHGGSIRCYIKKKVGMDGSDVKKFINFEYKIGIRSKKIFVDFSKKLNKKKNKFKNFLFEKKNKTIIGYGAAAKTTTLLNFLEISDNIKFVIDDNKLKQNYFIPGTKIKIVSKKKIDKKIDYLIVFAWNYFDEIKKKINYAKNTISIRKFLK